MQWEAIDILGLVGGVLLLFGFWRIQSGHWKVTSPWYELDNIIASILLLVYGWQKHAYVTALLNIVWCYVALKGLSSLAERRMMHNKNFRKGYRKGRALLHKQKVGRAS